MWQKSLYVVHVYAVVLLKLVHPEGAESSGRDRGTLNHQGSHSASATGTEAGAKSHPSLSMCGRCFGVPLRCFLWKWLKSSFSGCTSQPAPLQPRKAHTQT